MKTSFFAFFLVVLVTALPSVTLKHDGGRLSDATWEGGPSSVLRRVYVGDEDYYYLDFEIGYPPQSVSLLLDTGSSDIWISGPEICHNCTTYNISVSDSGKVINKGKQFWENYGYTVTGFYAADEFSIADTTVLNVTFGVANFTDRKPFDYGGVLGIGLIGLQSIATGCPGCGQNGPPAPGLLDNMKAAEVITASTYGIYLGGQNYSDLAPGEITFGGYNPARFSGPLLPLPMAPAPDQQPRVQAWLSSVSVTLNGKTELLRPESPNVLGTSILLDTGSPGSAIPNSMYYQLAEVLEVDPMTNRIPCEYAESDGGLTFGFLGFEGKNAEIWVPFKQFIKPLGHGLCSFTIGREYDCSRGPDVKSSCTTLGEDFLRAAYIYVNYDNMTVSMAQAAYNGPAAGTEKVGSGAQVPLRVQ